MNLRDILDEPSGRRLDSWVAEALGLSPCVCGPVGGYDPETGTCSRCGGQPARHYSTEIAAAWTLMQTMKDWCAEPVIEAGESQDGWKVTAESGSGPVVVECAAVELAICHVFLLVKGEISNVADG